MVSIWDWRPVVFWVRLVRWARMFSRWVISEERRSVSLDLRAEREEMVRVMPFRALWRLGFRVEGCRTGITSLGLEYERDRGLDVVVVGVRLPVEEFEP